MVKRAAVALVAVVLVSGCSGGTSSSKAKPADDKSSGIGIPVPSEALAPPPKVRSGDDARDLLKPDGDIFRLRGNVGANLADLKSMHVEESVEGVKSPYVESYDVDGLEDRCSGTVTDSGVVARFVTTADGRMLVTADQGELGRRLDGRWIASPSDELVSYCAAGPGGVTTRATKFNDGVGWLLFDAKRVSVEQVSGRRAVHFHQTANFRDSTETMEVDSWIAAHGPDARVLKLVMRYQDGEVRTATFSEFNSADPVAPEPTADQIFGNGSV